MHILPSVVWYPPLVHWAGGVIMVAVVLLWLPGKGTIWCEEEKSIHDSGHLHLLAPRTRLVPPRCWYLPFNSNAFDCVCCNKLVGGMRWSYKKLYRILDVRWVQPLWQKFVKLDRLPQVEVKLQNASVATPERPLFVLEVVFFLIGGFWWRLFFVGKGNWTQLRCSLEDLRHHLTHIVILAGHQATNQCHLPLLFRQRMPVHLVKATKTKISPWNILMVGKWRHFLLRTGPGPFFWGTCSFFFGGGGGVPVPYFLPNHPFFHSIVAVYWKHPHLWTLRTSSFEINTSLRTLSQGTPTSYQSFETRWSFQTKTFAFKHITCMDVVCMQLPPP